MGNFSNSRRNALAFGIFIFSVILIVFGALLLFSFPSDPYYFIGIWGILVLIWGIMVSIAIFKEIKG